MARGSGLVRELATFLGQPIRLPGWVTLALAIYSFVPDTKARLEFWGSVKVPPEIASYLASPLTGIVLGALAIAWLWFFRGVIHINRGLLTAETKPVASMQMDLMPSTPRAPHARTSFGPDWPIRELFDRLKPGILQTKNKADFESAGAEIMDKLSTGQLIAWGRALYSGRRLPLFREHCFFGWLLMFFGSRYQ